MIVTTSKMQNRPQVLMVGVDLQDKGGISTVLQFYKEGGLFDRILYFSTYQDGANWDKIKYFMSRLPRFFWILALNSSVEVLHIHASIRASFLRKSVIVLMSKLFCKKVVIHFHGMEFKCFYEQATAPMKLLIQAVFRTADHVLALSNQCQTNIQAITGNRNVSVLYNPTSLKTPVEQETNQVHFILMGRLGQRKGVYDIIKAASLLQGKNIRISLYGDGEVEQVRQLVIEKGLEHIIHVAGWISGDHKEAVFQSAHVLLLPSYNEGMPLSVLEALAYAMPIIATPVGGTGELVEHGLNGFLVQPGDCQMLAQAIDQLAASKALRASMGAESYNLAQRKFETSIILEQLQVIYTHLLKSNTVNA